ncbi:hypothetical protein KUH14_000003 [Vibrio parahaemolyticus]|nr:hypothetical protein [Vibrio parahaemolyticus]EHR0756271.1 hypothetical protein [Vibrio parahaemolyticus]EHR0829830.1 hypothetical protein [Vibrio parahaemolyticus]EHR1156846.1 hypothetical protein [Vibrio parahaemolyticus]EHR5006750.1 hypothetical protein [Vibrio parahaemolyticus]
MATQDYRYVISAYTKRHYSAMYFNNADNVPPATRAFLLRHANGAEKTEREIHEEIRLNWPDDEWTNYLSNQEPTVIKEAWAHKEYSWNDALPPSSP